MPQTLSLQSYSATAMLKWPYPNMRARHALRAKTERLKALRLARDAASPPKMGIDPKRKGKKKDDGRLSDWLDGQAKEGRRG